MAKIVEKPIEYKDGDVVLEGFVAYDDAKINGNKLPAVMVIHQWKGLGDYEKSRARMLAEMGYVGFACDIYGKGIRPQTAAEAGAQASKYKGDLPTYRRRLAAGLAAMAAQPGVDSGRLGAIGYCFGGTGALELARSGASVKGVVSFHGGLGTANVADAANIKGSVLVCHGAADPMVPPSEVEAFRQEMEAAKVDYVFMAFAGAKHSFTEVAAGNDPNSPVAYNEKADHRSWAAMQAFFAELFR